ncbi:MULTISPECIES: histidinol-phosphate transaminase [Streptomyces]|uniref:Aromatic amino acid aminotransferase n=1 Tax=Streptomyces tsukubensis (strain DSM 42081 / NBRC 108919 / NRRL 18488 / 9993) TaxID=1114943 RepID=I2N1X6_STRT9|nr:histidinol-phosphate transaminase [Streptomyces tsukubensis]MYS65911.1 histidinol-phosphate transaminase [Streptomyces sp. SID5473]AZK95160.1 histidinol-phosphate transaminase [Streptomyces tsukubensis]EIF91023.1 putative aminotransferase [Streptomyces tsukubensis NRRL18488]QKM68779.1 histidinol-phosphate transaminase [Streptomyces tsukubensis NRRL18488]TAI43584.1 histidinol-phosphate transaminase [Streptomyces tsukubensis]
MSETSPKLRVELDGIPTYKPGRPAAAAGGPVAYKLSSNENPYPPLPGVLETAVAAAHNFNRYPDMACTELMAELADRYGVPLSHLATGTGSVGVAQQLLQATSGPGDEVIYAWRSFEAYPIITRVSGATAVQVPLTPGDVHDLDAMAAAITDRTRLIFVCNPNNPTGTVVRRAELERFLDRVPSDVLVVLDEAYREFIRDADVPDGVEIYRDRPNVAVLRTFSKAYGLAGLRVGFAIAHEPVAAALRKTAVPFGVTQLAQDAAVASLRAEDELLGRVGMLVGERDRVHGALVGQGWTVPETQANFVWLRLGELTEEFAAVCEKEGVVVRPFPGEGVRITIGEPEANDLFLRVAGDFDKKL